MTDDEQQDIQESVEQQVALVGPVLAEMYKAAAEGRDYWLKKASLQRLTDWIMTVQDIATLMQQQLEAAEQVIAAQEQELEALRPVKRKMWTPLG